MEKIKYTYSILMISACLFFLQACVEVDDLVTPNVASPVLVMLQGTTFRSDSPVTVGSTILELDKTHILDHTRGIDSIPVPNLTLRVMIDHINEITSITTDNLGRAVFSATWEQLGLTTARVGNQVRLEFVGEHKNVPFRKYHTVRVN